MNYHIQNIPQFPKSGKIQGMHSLNLAIFQEYIPQILKKLYLCTIPAVADLQSATTEQRVWNPHNHKSKKTLQITNPQLNWAGLQIQPNDFRHHRTSA